MGNGSQWLGRESHSDRVIALALMSPFVMLALQYLVIVIVDPMLGQRASYVQVATRIGIALTYASALPMVFRRAKIRIFFVVTVAALLFAIQYIIYPQNGRYLADVLVMVFFVCIPSFFYASCISNLAILKRSMLQASYVVFSVGLLLAIRASIGLQGILGAYSMPLAYYMLLPSLMFIDALFDRRSVGLLLVTLSSLLIIAIFGARGPLFSVAVYIVFRFLHADALKKRTGPIIALTTTALVFTIFTYFEHIVKNMISWIALANMRSRTLELLIAQDLHLSGRELIFAQVWRGIASNPVVGVGLAGDRYILGGTYAHNFALEILAHFGVIVGGLVIALILMLLIRSQLCRNKEKRDIYTIWIALGFVHLLFSGSYLVEFQFWMFLGVLFRMVRIPTYIRTDPSSCMTVKQ